MFFFSIFTKEIVHESVLMIQIKASFKPYKSTIKSKDMLELQYLDTFVTAQITWHFQVGFEKACTVIKSIIDLDMFSSTPKITRPRFQPINIQHTYNFIFYTNFGFFKKKMQIYYFIFI